MPDGWRCIFPHHSILKKALDFPGGPDSFGRIVRRTTLYALAILILAAGFLFRNKILVTYSATQVCYEPGPTRCHSALKFVQDSTLDDRHAFGGEAWLLLGVPVAWRVWIYWVGDDYLAPVGRHDFNSIRNNDSTRVHGTIRADLLRRGSAYSIEAKLDSLPSSLWIELEKKP